MAVQDLERIESKIDKVVAGGTAVNMEFGGVRFQTYTEVMEFAKAMAISHAAVPPHCRGNVGTCLAVCTKALRFGFDPYALAEHSFVMRKPMDVSVETPQGGRITRKEDVETIAYDSYVIRAIIEAHAPIKGRMKYAFSGEGMERRCMVSAILRDGGDLITHESPSLGERLKSIGKNDRGHVKGSPLWESKPDQQLGYDTARDFCRRHFPDVLMGWLDKDELEETVRAETATDITPPKPDIASRLKGSKKKDKEPAAGFQIGHVEKTIAESSDGAAVAPRGADTNHPTPSTVAGPVSEIGSDAELTSRTAQVEKEPVREAGLPVASDIDSSETALERGARLLKLCTRPADIRDLKDTIVDELEGTERAVWLSACEARIKEVT